MGAAGWLMVASDLPRTQILNEQQWYPLGLLPQAPDGVRVVVGRTRRANQGVHVASAQPVKASDRSIAGTGSGRRYAAQEVNSGGIGLLVTLLVRANRRSQRLMAYGLSEHYRQIFELTRLDEAVSIHDTEQAALSAAGVG